MAGSGCSSWKELPHACGALCLRSASVILIELHTHRPLQSFRITSVPKQQPTPPLQLQVVANVLLVWNQDHLSYGHLFI